MGDADGRLEVVRGDGPAACQLLGLARDLAPGQFPGLDNLHNPADQRLADAAPRAAPAAALDELCQFVTAFFAGLGYGNILAVHPAPGNGSTWVIRLTAEADGWEIMVPVRRDASALVLELPSS